MLLLEHSIRLQLECHLEAQTDRLHQLSMLYDLLAYRLRS